MSEIVRQGDVRFIPVDSIPEEASRRARRALYRGEETEHPHVVDAGEFFETPRGALYLSTNEPASVRHDEYEPVVLRPGFYLVDWCAIVRMETILVFFSDGLHFLAKGRRERDLDASCSGSVACHAAASSLTTHPLTRTERRLLDAMSRNCEVMLKQYSLRWEANDESSSTRIWVPGGRRRAAVASRTIEYTGTRLFNALIRRPGVRGFCRRGGPLCDRRAWQAEGRRMGKCHGRPRGSRGGGPQ